MKKYNLNENNIEILAINLMLTLDELEMSRDVSVYFNNICARRKNDCWEWETNVHPRQYCQDASYYNILTIMSEGPLYDWYDYYNEMPKKIAELMEEFGLYLECATSWCWNTALLCDPSEYEEIAYDIAPKKPEEIYISLWNPACPSVLKNIMEYWYALSEREGDKGCCVLGASMNFVYKDVHYSMAPPSPWQGEGSWVPHVPFIKQMLEKIGATDIKYEYGRMD